jgi:hypothetical protein
MTDNLRDRLDKSILPTEWAMLAMHQKRHAVFMVKGSIELLEAAVAVAEDNAADVGAWLESGDLYRPTNAEIEAWSKEDGARFDSIIVQPFVLARRRVRAD